jgi:hypothetical protein
MQLTIRAIAIGSIVAVGLGCNTRADAGATPQPATPPLVEEQALSKPVKPPLPSPPSAAVPSGAAEPAAKATNAMCLAVCRKAEGLHCGAPEDCSTNCQEMLSLPGCQTAMVSFLECLSQEPLAHWECDSEAHIPAIRDGYCEAQQSGVARCLGKAS